MGVTRPSDARAASGEARSSKWFARRTRAWRARGGVRAEALEGRTLLSAVSGVIPDAATGGVTAGAISPPDLTQPGQAETFAVTYASAAGINPSTIKASNLGITRVDDSAPARVSSVQVSPSTGSPTQVTAVYTILPADGVWSGNDNGSWDVTLLAGQVADRTGATANENDGNDFGVYLPPDAALSAPNVTVAGGTTETVTAVFTDHYDIDTSTIAPGGISVTGPDGSLLDVAGLTNSPSDANAAVVTTSYVVAAPNGAWSSVDNGDYAVTLNPGGPAIQMGTAALEQTIHFDVNVANSPPGASLPLLPPITAPGTEPETVAVVYTAGAGINLATITKANLSVIGPGNAPLTVSGVTLDPSSGAPSRVTAIYTIQAPIGGWMFGDNGAYTVTLLPSQVADALGQTAPTASTAFAVDLAPPNADQTFANGSNVNLNFDGQSVAAQSDGDSVIAGFETNATTGATEGVLERLGPGGTPDATFGDGGTAVDFASANEAFYGVAVQGDGKVVAVGSGNGDLLVVRVNADGSPDSTFGADGRAAIAVGADADASAFAVTLDAAGDIVIAGAAGGDFVVDRLLPTGIPDPAFNGGAPVTFSGGAGVSALGGVDVEADGDIVLAGASGAEVVAARLQANGALDPAFGAGGLTVVSGLSAAVGATGQADHTEGLAVNPATGAIYVANNANGDFAVAQLKPDGTPNTGFGSGGVATADLGGVDDADVALIDKGDILLAGTTTSNGVTLAAVAAFSPNGSLDASFPGGGKEIFDTGLVSAGLATSAAPAPAITRDAEGIGAVVETIFGALQTSGQLLVGAGSASGSSADGSLRRLNVAVATSPGSTPTPTDSGTLAVSVRAALPASVVTGARVAAKTSVLIANARAGKAVKGRFAIALYASPSMSDAGASPLATIERTLDLAPGQSKSISIKTIVPTSTPGILYLLASVTPPGQSEAVAVGPAFSVSAAFVSVSATALRPVGDRVAPGKSAPIGLTLHNAGNAAAVGNATLTILASAASGGTGGQQVAVVPVKLKLKPGAVAAYRLKVVFPADFPAGTYDLTGTLGGAVFSDDGGAAIPVDAATPFTVA